MDLQITFGKNEQWKTFIVHSIDKEMSIGTDTVINSGIRLVLPMHFNTLFVSACEFHSQTTAAQQ